MQRFRFSTRSEVESEPGLIEFKILDLKICALYSLQTMQWRLAMWRDNGG